MKHIMFMVTAMCVLFFAGCTKNQSVVASSNNIDPLLNTKWDLKKIDDKILKLFVTQGSAIGFSSIEFDNSSIYGTTGVNRIKGAYVVADNKLLLSSMALTRMAAINPILQANEIKIMSILNSDDILFSISNNTLTIKSINGTLTYTKNNPLLNTSWSLNGISGKNIENQHGNFTRNSPTLEISNKLMFGFSGVNYYRAPYEISGDTISTSMMISTQMAPLSDELADIESSFLRILQSVQNYEISEDNLLLKAGDEFLSFSKIYFNNGTFNNNVWELVSMYGDDIKKLIADNTKLPVNLNIEFKNDAVYGNAGVNRFSGNYALVDRNIYISPLATTLMLGSSEFLNNLEQKYLRLLNEVEYFELTNHETMVFYSNNETMVFKRVYM